MQSFTRKLQLSLLSEGNPLFRLLWTKASLYVVFLFLGFWLCFFVYVNDIGMSIQDLILRIFLAILLYFLIYSSWFLKTLQVREVVSILDIDVLFYPCPRNGPNFRPKVLQMGGKQQFPYMVSKLLFIFYMWKKKFTNIEICSLTVSCCYKSLHSQMYWTYDFEVRCVSIVDCPCAFDIHPLFLFYNSFNSVLIIHIPSFKLYWSHILLALTWVHIFYLIVHNALIQTAICQFSC